MMSRNVVMLLAIAAPGLLFAQDNTKFQCTYGDLQRRVEIYTEPGQAVPCEVHYFKDTEAPGESQVLWTASNDASYCETKTREFVAKLQGWGWDCGAGDAAAEPEPEPMHEEAAEPDVQDDTDVLSPGDPSGS